jgi:hypothetical protein
MRFWKTIQSFPSCFSKHKELDELEKATREFCTACETGGDIGVAYDLLKASASRLDKTLPDNDVLFREVLPFIGQFFRIHFIIWTREDGVQTEKEHTVSDFHDDQVHVHQTEKPGVGCDFHMESNFVHCMMCGFHMVKHYLEDTKDPNAQDAAKLFVLGFLHDCSKRACMIPGKSYIAYPAHDTFGAFSVARILGQSTPEVVEFKRTIGLSDEEVEIYVHTIAGHMCGCSHAFSEHTTPFLSGVPVKVRPYLLKLARSDRAASISMVDETGAVAYYNDPRATAALTEGRLSDMVQHYGLRSTVFIMLGISGSGKSTEAGRIIETLKILGVDPGNIVLLERDDIGTEFGRLDLQNPDASDEEAYAHYVKNGALKKRVDAAIKERTREALNDGKIVIISSCAFAYGNFAQMCDNSVKGALRITVVPVSNYEIGTEIHHGMNQETRFKASPASLHRPFPVSGFKLNQMKPAFAASSGDKKQEQVTGSFNPHYFLFTPSIGCQFDMGVSQEVLEGVARMHV